MTSLAELPGVLLVADSYANVWTEERTIDFATGNPVTYRRAKMFVRVDEEPHYYRVSFVFPTEVADALPAPLLAEDVGRQVAIAIKTARFGRQPEGDPED